ncbi:hypothetical protein VTI74DRAFT_7380 [Chaetomium olivicolor]
MKQQHPWRGCRSLAASGCETGAAKAGLPRPRAPNSTALFGLVGLFGGMMVGFQASLGRSVWVRCLVRQTNLVCWLGRMQCDCGHCHWTVVVWLR